MASFSAKPESCKTDLEDDRNLKEIHKSSLNDPQRVVDRARSNDFNPTLVSRNLLTRRSLNSRDAAEKGGTFSKMKRRFTYKVKLATASKIYSAQVDCQYCDILGLSQGEPNACGTHNHPLLANNQKPEELPLCVERKNKCDNKEPSGRDERPSNTIERKMSQTLSTSAPLANSEKRVISDSSDSFERILSRVAISLTDILPIQKPYPLFGLPLTDAATLSDPRGLVPLPVRAIIKHLDATGMDDEGLFRVPGSLQRVYQLRKSMNELAPMTESSLIREMLFINNDDVHTTSFDLCSLLGHYESQLPDTKDWIPLSLRGELKTINALGSEDRQLGVKRLLMLLPVCHRETIRMIAGLLCRIAENSETTKMTAAKLAVCAYPMTSVVWKIIISNYRSGIFPVSVIFGKRLDTVLNIENDIALEKNPGGRLLEIPSPLYVSWRFLEESDDLDDCIYVANGRHSVVKQYIREFNSGNTVQYDQGHTREAASVVLSFLRDLPETLGLHNRAALAKVAQPLRHPETCSLRLCSSLSHEALHSVASMLRPPQAPVLDDDDIARVTDFIGELPVSQQAIFRRFTKHLHTLMKKGFKDIATQLHGDLGTIMALLVANRDRVYCNQKCNHNDGRF
eukprot:CFRG3018T1